MIEDSVFANNQVGLCVFGETTATISRSSAIGNGTGIAAWELYELGSPPKLTLDSVHLVDNQTALYAFSELGDMTIWLRSCLVSGNEYGIYWEGVVGVQSGAAGTNLFNDNTFDVFPTP